MRLKSNMFTKRLQENNASTCEELSTAQTKKGDSGAERPLEATPPWSTRGKIGSRALQRASAGPLRDRRGTSHSSRSWQDKGHARAVGQAPWLLATRPGETAPFTGGADAGKGGLAKAKFREPPKWKHPPWHSG